MIKMKKVFVLLSVTAALAAFAIYVYLNPFLFMPVETQNCGREDIGCIKEMETKRWECIPSSTIISGRDGIILMVNITREGDKCVRTETVIGSEELQSIYLLGHNVTCISNLSEMSSKPQVCPGSLYDYVKSSGGGESPGGVVMPAGPPVLTCILDDQECKTTADGYLQNCITSKITNTEYMWLPDGYWTLFFDVSRLAECHYYVEVLNAVNLPPGTPTAIIGYNMTCDVPLSELPVGPLNSSWCEGDLYDYLHP